jgi:hypothetical protein
VCLRIVGPVLDAEYAAQVSEAINLLNARGQHGEAPTNALGGGGAEAVEAASTASPSVLYCGALERRDLHLAMVAADIVLNTSISEVCTLS